MLSVVKLLPEEQKILDAIRRVGAIFTMDENCPPLPAGTQLIPSQPALFSRKIKPHLPPHFLLASKTRHSKIFFQMSLALRYADVSYLIAQKLKAELAKNKILDAVQVILGPPMGALSVIYSMSHAINSPEVEAMYLERVQGGGFRLGRGFTIAEKNVLFVDDVFTSGGSINAAILACEAFCKSVDAGYFPLGVAVALDRSPLTTLSLEIRSPAFPIVSALKYSVEDFSPEECPACEDGHPLVRI